MIINHSNCNLGDTIRGDHLKRGKTVTVHSQKGREAGSEVREEVITFSIGLLH